VLSSVHAFATDPARGLFILAFLVVVVGGSLGLFAWRAPRIPSGGRFAPLSRETLLLLNNVLLVAAAGSVLIGTLYPLFIDALGLGKLSVGAPYFNTVFVPVTVPLLFLVALGPLARWKQLEPRELWSRLRVPAALALAAGMVLPFLMGRWSPLVAMGLLLAVWIAASTIFQLRERLKSGLPPLSFWGMHLAHLGVAVFVAGVTLVKGYEVEKDVRLAVGDTVQVGSHAFRLLGVTEVPGPNYVAQRGEIELLAPDGRRLRTLHPEKRHYVSSRMPMTEAAIDSGIAGDLYVSLGEPLDASGAWSVRVYDKPFVTWIWAGCLLMAVGGAASAADRRYRLKKAQAVPRGATA